MTLKTHPIHLILGFTLWAVYFVVVYGGMSVGCEVSDVSNHQGPFTWVNGFVLLVTLGFTLVLLWLGWLCHRQTPDKPNQARFLMRSSAVLYLLAALATLFVGLPGAIYPPCL